MTPAEYWQSNRDLVHITPPGERFPEKGLFEALEKAVKGSVFEFGCGDGRLSPAFDKSAYTGFDINPNALEAAKTNNPGHTYSTEWVQADTFLAYTVLLHVSDDELPEIIEKAKGYDRIVIGEIMGRQWRRPGNPPVFNRDIEEYADLVGRDYSIIEVPYPRYGCNLDLMVFVK
jgi:SAM-dependent methyltransferase